MSSFVIGDIQGCYAELRTLLRQIQFRADIDTLYIAGDLLNRGPNNIDTLSLLQDLGAHCVLGNHDLHFLAVTAGVKAPGKSDTLEDLLESPKLGEIVNWYVQQPLLIELEEFDGVLVHAGVPHIWSLTQAAELAQEVEQILKSEQREQYFNQMYGNSPERLNGDIDQFSRARVITNYFTRMRFCNAEGALELETKTEIAPEGYAPWFSFDRADTKRIFFGHWAAIEGKTPSSQFVALDTGCVWGQALTAIRLDDDQLFSVPAGSDSKQS